MNVLAYDTETFLIGPGAIAPKMVCVTVANEDGRMLVGNGDDHCEDFLRDLFKPGHILVGHNVAYDLGVVIMSYPHLENLVWTKLLSGEITCTKIREQLLNLSTHGKLDMVRLPDGSTEKLSYSLATLENLYLGIDRSALKVGDDVWRLNYHTLDGWKGEDYPDEAREYAEDDAEGTYRVYMAQEARQRTEEGPASFGTQFFHTAADLALFMMTIRGMEIDPEEVEKSKAMIAHELSPEKLGPLYDCGILRRGEPSQPYVRSIKKALELMEIDEVPEDWAPFQELLEENGIKFKAAVEPSKDMKVLKGIIEEISKEHGIEIKETKTGATSTDSEVVADLAEVDERMGAYKHRQSLQKLVTTEIPRMQWEGETSKVVHFPFRVLLETGRTSSFANKLYPSGNGQQLHPLIRPCYKARDGMVLISIDYSTVELGAVGQTMLNLFGKSVHADRINAGDDLHAFLAARMAYELDSDFRATCDESNLSTGDELYGAFMSLKGHPSMEEVALPDGSTGSFYKWWRKFSKPVGLGYPGGLGAVTFIGLAKKGYGVNLMDIADSMEFEVTPALLKQATRAYGISKEDFEWTPQTKALALAMKLKDIWLDTFEMRPFYEHVQKHMKDQRNAHLGTREEDGSPIQGFCYTSPLGMHRAGCSYTACANGKSMQTPSAEGNKLAVIRVVQESRIGSLVDRFFALDFIHDEILGEAPEEIAAEVAEEVGDLMEESMRAILPGVNIKTEKVLMRKWNKYADPTFDANGKLVVTEPEPATPIAS